MAEISITAMGHGPGLGGPDLPLPLYAFVKEKPWPGGGTTSVLVMILGKDTVELWPIDYEYLRNLGKKLIEIADSQEKKELK